MQLCPTADPTHSCLHFWPQWNCTSLNSSSSAVSGAEASMRRSAADASFRYAKSGSTRANLDCASRNAVGISPLSRSSSAVSTLPCATCTRYHRHLACVYLSRCSVHRITGIYLRSHQNKQRFLWRAVDAVVRRCSSGSSRAAAGSGRCAAPQGARRLEAGK